MRMTKVLYAAPKRLSCFLACYTLYLLAKVLTEAATSWTDTLDEHLLRLSICPVMTARVELRWSALGTPCFTAHHCPFHRESQSRV